MGTYLDNISAVDLGAYENIQRPHRSVSFALHICLKKANCIRDIYFVLDEHVAVSFTSR
jgi:hypothetical protein